MDRIKIIMLVTGLFQLMNCQKMEKKYIIPTYNVQLSHTANKHLITPVEDSLITLEGISAGLPYGSSSGVWGSSGKGSSDQGGTPIGADIKYYAESENLFYHLKAKFPIEKVKDIVQRAYAVNESESSDEPMKEYINIPENPDYYEKYNYYTKAYYEMSDLIFGFAPTGVVVVWIGFGPTQIELGQYQAEKITDEAEIKRLKEKYQKIYNIYPSLYEELAIEYFLPNQSAENWIQYRTRYSWTPKITSENQKFKLFNTHTNYYNGERDILLRPFVEHPAARERAIPKVYYFLWETGKGEAYEGRAFFNWEKTNETFKKAGKNFNVEYKIAPDNNSFEVFVNGQPFSPDSIRIYKSNRKFKESTK